MTKMPRNKIKQDCHFTTFFSSLSIVSIFVYVENIYDVGNPAPGLGQTKPCGLARPVN
jgi:hypothetical protein